MTWTFAELEGLQACDLGFCRECQTPSHMPKCLTFVRKRVKIIDMRKEDLDAEVETQAYAIEVMIELEKLGLEANADISNSWYAGSNQSTYLTLTTDTSDGFDVSNDLRIGDHNNGRNFTDLSIRIDRQCETPQSAAKRFAELHKREVAEYELQNA